jgi:hypothetical protein
MAEEVSKEEGGAVLDSEQEEHLGRLKTIARRSLCYVDYSPTGRGKTRVTCAFARDCGLPMLVICPNSAFRIWSLESARFGARIVDLISLGGLSGRINCKLNHPYLIRYHNSKEDLDIFKVTPVFADLAESGLLLVLDEAHNAKNVSTCIHNAFATLSQYIAMTGGTSRIALLSATLVDKAGMQCVAAVEILGLAPTPLYTVEKFKPIVKTGFGQLQLAAERYNPVLARRILFQPTDTAQGIRNAVTRLFVDVFLPNIGSTMRPIIYRGIARRFDYKYYRLSPKAAERYNDVCLEIQQNAHRVFHREEARGRQVNQAWGAINKLLVQLECVLIEPTLRQALEWLRANPSAKVVICLNFIWCNHPEHGAEVDEEGRVVWRGAKGGTVEPEAEGGTAQRGNHLLYLQRNLAEFNPVLIHGGVSPRERVARIALFQEASLACRVMIATSPTVQVSIDLHDTSGGRHPAMQVSRVGRTREVTGNADEFDPRCDDACAGPAPPEDIAPEEGPTLEEEEAEGIACPSEDVGEVGRFPRFVIVEPSYFLTMIHQIAGRFYRHGVTSGVTLVIPLGQGPVRMRSLLDSLARKTKMLEMITGHAAQGVIFPGNYGVVVEGIGRPLTDAELQDLRGNPEELSKLFKYGS